MLSHPLPLSQPPQLQRCNRALNISGHSRYQIDWWSLLLFEYRAELRLDDRAYNIKPGCLALVPPSVVKHYHCPTAQPRHRFIHFEIASSRQDHYMLPEFITDCSSTPAIERDFDQVMRAEQQARRQAAEIHLWHLLLRLAESYGSHNDLAVLHPACARVHNLLEQHLQDAPGLQELARTVELSPNHLNKLFKRDFGETVHARLIRLRTDRAHDLLLHSDTAIRDIADSVGIPDLQAFNKAIHRRFGKSPRTLRSGS